MALSLNPSRALLNQDVVYAVLEHLAVPDASWYDYDAATRGAKSRDYAGERRGTLARCARVCRSFFPAVSVLWRNLGSLETLYALEQRYASQTAEVAVSVGLSWLPTYAQYSNWVRAVHSPSQSVSKQSSQLSTLNKGLRIARLPRLTHLRWIQHAPETMDLFPLLSPSLRSLHIIFRNSRNATRHERQTFVEELLLQAAKRAPNLTYLRITRTSGIPEAWLLPVDQFTGLEVLDILEPSYDVVTTCDLLPRLAAMESLRSLKLHLPAAATHSARDSDLASRNFRVLRDLHQDCKHTSLPDAITLLRSISAPYLDSVRIEECECPTASLSADLLEFCTVLHARFAPTVRGVSLSVTPIGPPVVLERPLVEYLGPLLRIRELVEFRLDISRMSKNVWISVPEPNLAAIAEAWPRLTRLHLDYVSVDGPAAVPVRALLVFARHCPSLTSLDLPCIDARGVEALTSELDRPHFSLTSYSVLDGGWDSVIPGPEGLAQFLRTLFPNVTLGRQRLEAEPWRRTVESLEAGETRLIGEAF